MSNLKSKKRTYNHSETFAQDHKRIKMAKMLLLFVEKLVNS